jgi:hypothetical protein
MSKEIKGTIKNTDHIKNIVNMVLGHNVVVDQIHVLVLLQLIDETLTKMCSELHQIDQFASRPTKDWNKKIRDITHKYRSYYEGNIIKKN